MLVLLFESVSDSNSNSNGVGLLVCVRISIQKQHITNSMSSSLINSLHFEADQLNDCMSEARSELKKWANWIEADLSKSCT